MNAWERLLNDYTLNKARLPGHSRPWLTAMRERASKDFAAQGLPDPRDENWKYTRIQQLLQINYDLAQQQPDPDITLSAKIKQHCSGEHCLVFINGCYKKQLSSVSGLPEGLILSSFAEAVQYHPNLLASALRKTGNYQELPFSLLNTAMMSDGVFLWAADNTAIEAPIHCLFIAAAAAHPVVNYSRLLLVLKNNARLTLLEHYLDLTPADDSQTAQTNRNQNLLNTVTEIHLSPQAEMIHYKLQYDSVNSTHIAAMYVQQQQASHFTSHSYSFGGALARHDIQVQLCERQAECSLHGAYLVDRQQHVDYHTQIEHLAPACNSLQVYKGVVQGQARAVFNGKVNIHPDAQQSNARQLNKNLLLGDNAEVDTKPELQIYADDVLCSHGATVGQLDAQTLFYLCSRGVSKKDAQAWLVYGFISDVLERINNPAMRQLFEQAAVAQLKQLLGDTSGLQALFPTENGNIACH